MALYTQDRLAETLKALMREKPLDKITVQELVARAQVNRKTFYFHFHSIGDLLKWRYGTELDRMIDSAPIVPETWMERFSELTRRMRAEAPYLNAIFASSYGAEFRAYTQRYFDRVTSKFIRAAIERYEADSGRELYLTQKQFSYINRYYSMAFYGMVEQWFAGGMQDTDEEFVHIMKQLSRDNMYRTFASMHAENRRQG